MFHATRITKRQMIPVIPAPFFTYSNKELTFDCLVFFGSLNLIIFLLLHIIIS